MKPARRLLLCVLLLLVLAGCGKRGPLVAPETLRYPAVKDLAALQRGDRLQLSWSNPYGPTAGIASFRLYRREVLPPGQDCEECTDAYQLVRTVDLEMPNGVVQDGNRFVMSDAEVQAGKSYRYLLRSVLTDGTVAAVSSPIRVTLASLPSPPRLAAELSPVSVILSWEPVPASAGGAPVRYQVYRRQGDAPWPALPLTAKPLETTRYEDFPPVRGVAWSYVVRGVVSVNGSVAETAASQEATVVLPPPEQ